MTLKSAHGDYTGACLSRRLLISQKRRRHIILSFPNRTIPVGQARWFIDDSRYSGALCYKSDFEAATNALASS